MRITVIGCGYVGLVTGACFTEMGNFVTCVDQDEARLAMLARGEVPIFEPGLAEIIGSALESGLIEFTSDIAASLETAEYVFIAVGTPPKPDGSVDMAAVESVARAVGRHIKHELVVINKSTVPVGTVERVSGIIDEELSRRGVTIKFHVVSNPEFLKEGTAVRDFMGPDRVIVGVESEEARSKMSALYAPYLKKNDRLMFMGARESEMTKYAANAMLAARISFMNELAELCERTGVDVDAVRSGMGADSRIGYSFLYPGCGYGGSCFPKDVQALMHIGRQVGMDMGMLREVEERNRHQKNILFEKLNDYFHGELSGKRIAVWGLSFKPGTDDMREAPSINLIRSLLAAGAYVLAHDPCAVKSAEAEFLDVQKDRLLLSDSQYEVVDQADALVLVTEWKRFRSPDFSRLMKQMRGRLIVDGRNQYDPKFLRKSGFDYLGVGRSNIDKETVRL